MLLCCQSKAEIQAGNRRKDRHADRQKGAPFGALIMAYVRIKKDGEARGRSRDLTAVGSQRVCINRRSSGATPTGCPTTSGALGSECVCEESCCAWKTLDGQQMGVPAWHGLKSEADTQKTHMDAHTGRGPAAGIARQNFQLSDFYTAPALTLY